MKYFLYKVDTNFFESLKQNQFILKLKNRRSMMSQNIGEVISATFCRVFSEQVEHTPLPTLSVKDFESIKNIIFIN